MEIRIGPHKVLHAKIERTLAEIAAWNDGYDSATKIARWFALAAFLAGVGLGVYVTLLWS